MMMKRWLWLLTFALVGAVHAQQTDSTVAALDISDVPTVDRNPLRLLLPPAGGNLTLDEGQPLTFTLRAQGGDSTDHRFALNEGVQTGMEMTPAGAFSWTPAYDLVGRLEKSKDFPVLMEVSSGEERATRRMVFRVQHANRPPTVEQLKPLYVRYRAENTYEISPEAAYDADGDPIVFVPIQQSMPEGAQLTESGTFTWRPSLTQFNALRRQPLVVRFYAEDQPAKARTEGELVVGPTQRDLPPLLSIVPEAEHVRLRENETINLQFYLTDPNGDGDVANFGFVSSQTDIPPETVVKNAATSYEFIWTPPYDLVQDPVDSLTFDVVFFVIDRAQQRDEDTVRFTVYDAVNEEALDRQRYEEYRQTLVRAWELIEQLNEVERDLKRKYKKAKKGKRNRSIANASLGIVTGVTPALSGVDQNTRTVISSVGGTTVATIGTLEATEVIGRSTRDLLDRINYVIEKKNQIQLKGDAFARKYALRSDRRTDAFRKGRDELRGAMALKGLVALELDADWEPKRRATDKVLSNTFRDFVPDELVAGR